MYNDENLEKMIKAVLDKANQESESILSLAEKAKERNLRPFREQAEHQRELYLVQFKKNAEQEVSRKKAALEMDANMRQLEQKHEFYGKIKDCVLALLNQWVATDEYHGFYCASLEATRKYWEDENSIVRTRKEDCSLCSEYLEKNYHNGKVPQVVAENMAGGFIVENSQCHVFIDLRLESIFNDWYDDKKHKIFQTIWERS